MDLSRRNLRLIVRENVKYLKHFAHSAIHPYLKSGFTEM